jgi:plasmid stabilization system protein ParE
MAFRVEYSARAEQDLDPILEWLIEQEAGQKGLLWFKKLQAAITTVCDLPNRCQVAPENEQFPFEVRQLLYGRKPHQYRILFTSRTRLS